MQVYYPEPALLVSSNNFYQFNLIPEKKMFTQKILVERVTLFKATKLIYNLMKLIIRILKKARWGQFKVTIVSG